MFANIFFLFLLLIVVGNAPQVIGNDFLIRDPWLALSLSIVLYCFIGSLIIIQNRFLIRKYDVFTDRLVFLTNFELIAYFICSYFVLGAQRLVLSPIFSPISTTVFTLYSLLLFFIGLFICHHSINQESQSSQRPFYKAWTSTRYLIPTVIPFILLMIFSDLSTLIPYKQIKHSLGFEEYPWIDTLLFTTLSLFVIIITLILLPPLLIAMWRCPPMQTSPVLERLEELCRKAKFKHGGFKIWTIMEDSFNAAIIGIIGKFRYIIFTPKLLQRLSPNAIEAILAHEMGHNKHRHLLIYPFILLGMLAAGGFFSSIILDPILEYTSVDKIITSIANYQLLIGLISLVLFMIICAVYYRIIFGYFSRQFERQADLYVFDLDVPPQYMIEALDEIAHAAGGIHLQPNWHHASIQDRIDFLEKARLDPSLIAKHHRKVRLSLTLYVLALIPILIFLRSLSDV